MYQKLKTKLKASMLVVTLMIMGVILVSTLSIALVAVQERKASVGQNTSSQAYNKAEDGVEIVMQNILKDGHTTVGQLSNCNATTGRIDGNGYAVELKKSDDTKINCNTDATTSLSDIASVKSIGTVGENQRAVEVAVAAEPNNWCKSVDLGIKKDPANIVSASQTCANESGSDWFLPTHTELSCFIGSTNDTSELMTRTGEGGNNRYATLGLATGGSGTSCGVGGCSLSFRCVKYKEASVPCEEKRGCGSLVLGPVSGNASTTSFMTAVNNCKSLGSDWMLPTFEELACFIGASGATNERLWTRLGPTGEDKCLNIGTGERWDPCFGNTNRYRCVEHIGS